MGLWAILWYYLRIYLEEMWKIMKNLSGYLACRLINEPTTS